MGACAQQRPKVGAGHAAAMRTAEVLEGEVEARRAAAALTGAARRRRQRRNGRLQVAATTVKVKMQALRVGEIVAHHCPTNAQPPLTNSQPLLQTCSLAYKLPTLYIT